MILRRWMPNMGRLDLDLYKLPIWFHLLQLPLNLYNRKGISYTASAIGVPLYMDSITTSKSRLSYAKVCIEVCADVDPPDMVDVELEDGSIASVGVSIPWKPLVCKSCKLFGHSDSTCSKKTKVKQVWKEKENLMSAVDYEARNKKDAEENAPVLNEETVGKEAKAVPVKETVEKELVPVNEAPLKDTFLSGKSKWSPPVKHSITGSSNKYAVLVEELPLDENNDETDDRVNVDPSVTIWKNLVENTKYTHKKTRAASKGVALTVNEVKGRKAKIVTKGTKNEHEEHKRKKFYFRYSRKDLTTDSL